MNDEHLYKPTKAKDPKLSIKSSMPQLREGLGWLLLLYIACDDDTAREPFTPIEPGDGGEEDVLSLKNESIEQIETYLRRHDIPNSDINALLSPPVTTPLGTAQIESLIASFSLFFPLTEITFVEKSRNMAAERKGRKRYEKQFRFSSEIRTLGSLIDNSAPRGPELVLSWCAGRPYIDTDLEHQMQLELLKLCANTTIRLQRTGNKHDDEYLNVLGLYMALHERESHSFSLAGQEAKGSLRILKSAIGNRLLPWVTIDNNHVILSNGNTLAEVTRIIDEIKVEFDLKYIEQPEKEIFEGVETTSSVGNDRIGRNIILYGVPGSGKSYTIDTDYINEGDEVTRVVFHPDYLYANFVGQILPTVENEDLTYKFRPGPFTHALRKALRVPDRHHFLIIEEINRGNAAAIFGDIFQLLDRDEKGQSQYSITNRNIALSCYGDPEHPISLPGNLTILATMNTSDQNIFTLDTAFQRRWEMKLIINDINQVSFADNAIGDTSVTWKNFVTVVNGLIIQGDLSVSSNEDKRLGNFFINEVELANAESFAQKVLKYLWDDAFKFDRAKFFKNSNSSSLEDVMTAFCWKYEGDQRWENILIDSVCSMLGLPRTSPSAEHLLPNDDE